MALFTVVGVYRLARRRPKAAHFPVSQTVKHWLHIIFPLRFGYGNLFVSLVQLQWFIHFQRRQGIEGFSFTLYHIIVYGAGFISLNLLVQWVNSVAGRSRPLRLFLNLGVAYCCCILGAYHFHTRNSLEFSVVSDNKGEVFSMETVEALSQSVGAWYLLAGLGVMVVLWLLDGLKIAPFSREQSKPRIVKIVSVWLLYGLLVLSPLPTRDEFVYFLKSAYGHYAGSSPYRVDIPAGQYPLVTPGRSSLRYLKPGEPSPNIIFVVIESFNTGFVETGKSARERHMPFFSQHIEQGMYVENFYGNSIQTAKGHAAVLCSLIPNIKGKIFQRFPGLSLHSLAAVLKTRGYDTLFFQASPKLDFDNTREFMKGNGFDVTASAYHDLSAAERKRVGNWYMRDHLLYRAFFARLDSRFAASSARPVFAFLAPTFNHSGFDRIAKNDRRLYPEPKDKAQRYANSIRLVDDDLKYFFQEVERREYLRNGIIVVTGDHSYPVGGHGIEHNEGGFYEESFRVPFFLSWPGRVRPVRIAGAAYSQVDIAPTIIDFLGIKGVPVHFQGVSMLDRARREHPVYLVQPYRGRYLGVVRYPYKYLFHERTGDIYCYNIKEDPGESFDLWPRRAGRMENTLRDDLRVIYLTQALTEKNAVWPGVTDASH